MKSKKQDSDLGKSVFSLLFFVVPFLMFMFLSSCKLPQSNKPTQNQKLKIFSIYDPLSDFNGLAVFYPREVVITGKPPYIVSIPIRCVNMTDDLVFLSKVSCWDFEIVKNNGDSCSLSYFNMPALFTVYAKVDGKDKKSGKYEALFKPSLSSCYTFKYEGNLSEAVSCIKKGNHFLNDTKMRIKISNLSINAYSSVGYVSSSTNMEFNIKVTVDPNRKVTKEDQLDAFKAVVDELVKKGRIKPEQGEKIKKGGTSFNFIQVCSDIKELENNNLIALTKKECDLDEMKKDLSYLDGYKCGKILGEQGQVGVFIVAPENCKKKKLWYSGFRTGEKDGMEIFLAGSSRKKIREPVKIK